MFKTLDEFELAFRRHQDSEGCSYDPWDIMMARREYQVNPRKYDWLVRAEKRRLSHLL